MKRYIISCSMLLILLPLLFSCTKEELQHVSATRYVPQELFIGLIPAQNVFHQQECYIVLKQYFDERSDVMIIVTILSSYGNIVGRFSSEKLDGAFFGILTNALAHQPGVEQIARPGNLDGTSTYRIHLFTGSDSGILAASKGFPQHCFAVCTELDLKLKTTLKLVLLDIGTG